MALRVSSRTSAVTDRRLARAWRSSATVWPTTSEVRGDARLRHVVLDVERRIEGGGAPAVARQQAVADGEEGDAGERDAEADGREVEHLNGSPVSSPRRRETMMLGEVPTRVTMPPSSEPKAIGIRKARGRGVGAPGDLEGDRHQHGERADVLHEGGEHRHGGDQHDDLGLGGAGR